MAPDTRMIAARYATALFDLAQDEGKHAEVKEDLRMLTSVLTQSTVLRRFMENPVITRAQAEHGVDTVLTAMNARPLTRKFFALLARERRLGLAVSAIEKYLSMLAESQGETAVRITSAGTLGESQVQLITGALARATGRKIEVQVGLNPALIGGIQVQIGSRMLDSSVAGKLSRLSRAMTEAA